MDYSTKLFLARRHFLRAAAMASGAALLAACGGQASVTPTDVPAAPTVAPTDAPIAPTDVPPTAVASDASAVPTVAPTNAPPTAVAVAQLQPTPACDDDDEPTPPAAEGPFYTPNSPERASLLEPGINGTTMVLTGQVLTTGCTAIAGALVDVWHCDDAGVYDNAGYRLRGHQFTDADGRYRFETIIPGLYPGRTRHFHIKVQAANGPILTTQLYFPDEADNDRDRLYNPALLVTVDQSAGMMTATFDFVLNV